MKSDFSIGIMQPYFFPYWGHFALIAAVDRWIVFDITQYMPKSWMNRNRILHPTKDWLYVTVPLDKASRSIKTFQARMLNPDTAGMQILRQLAHYKKHAPYFAAVTDLVERTFANLPDESLVTLNTISLKETCTYLDIPFRYNICSRLDLDLPEEMGPGDWAPTIASRLGASKYINPIGGRDLFNPQQFTDLGIELAFLETGHFEYSTPGYEFQPNLSILDAMMWNSPETIKKALTSLTQIVPAQELDMELTKSS